MDLVLMRVRDEVSQGSKKRRWEGRKGGTHDDTGEMHVERPRLGRVLLLHVVEFLPEVWCWVSNASQPVQTKVFVSFSSEQKGKG